jgi:CRISPR-associated protein Cmr5
MPANTHNPAVSLDQCRARHAWKVVDDVEKNSKKDDAKKFGGQARKLPMRIIGSGLGQALAFLKAKDYAPQLLIALSDWFLYARPGGQGKQPRPNGGALETALLETIIHGDADLLRRATDEVLAYLMWLNRFAEAKGLTEGE